MIYKYDFETKRPFLLRRVLQKLFAPCSRGCLNAVLKPYGKAYLFGAVKVRILGIPFTVCLRPDDYRALAKGFNRRSDAVKKADAIFAHTGRSKGTFEVADDMPKSTNK